MSDSSNNYEHLEGVLPLELDSMAADFALKTAVVCAWAGRSKAPPYDQYAAEVPDISGFTRTLPPNQRLTDTMELPYIRNGDWVVRLTDLPNDRHISLYLRASTLCLQVCVDIRSAHADERVYVSKNRLVKQWQGLYNCRSEASKGTNIAMANGELVPLVKEAIVEPAKLVGDLYQVTRTLAEVAPRSLSIPGVYLQENL